MNDDNNSLSMEILIQIIPSLQEIAENVTQARI